MTAIAWWLIMGAVLWLTPLWASAATVSPERVEVVLKDLEEIFFLKVFNSGDEEERCRIIILETTPRDEERPTLNVQHETLTLAPGEVFEVKCIASRSLDAPAGRFHTSVHIKQEEKGDKSATAKIELVVPEELSVATETREVEAEKGSGPAWVVTRFRVKANVPKVNLWVTASPLFFHDDPHNTAVAAIPLAKEQGVEITTSEAAAIQGGRKSVDFSSNRPIADYPGVRTDTVKVINRKHRNFNHEVWVKVFWQHIDPRRAAGRYDGLIKLTAEVAAD